MLLFLILFHSIDREYFLVIGLFFVQIILVEFIFRLHILSTEVEAAELEYLCYKIGGEKVNRIGM